MLRYSINILVFLCVFNGWAQDETIDLQPQDTVMHKQTYGLRVGVDLSRIIITQTNEDYSGLEIVGDYRLTQKLYIAGELGNEKRTKQEDLFNYSTSGGYIKIGVDYNTYENWYGMNNTIFIGGRYAVSRFSQTLNSFQYFDTNRYWNPDGFPDGGAEPIEFDGRSKSWIEAILGIKAELFANIYLGGSIRFGFMFSDPQDKPFPNPFVPGFNKVTDGSKFGVGYNYSLTYMIPLYKKAKKRKETEIEVETGQ